MTGATAGAGDSGEHPAVAEVSSMFESILNKLRALLGRQPDTGSSGK
jgi:hypothetical protein